MLAQWLLLCLCITFANALPSEYSLVAPVEGIVAKPSGSSAATHPTTGIRTLSIVSLNFEIRLLNQTVPLSLDYSSTALALKLLLIQNQKLTLPADKLIFYMNNQPLSDDHILKKDGVIDAHYRLELTIQDPLNGPFQLEMDTSMSMTRLEDRMSALNHIQNMDFYHQGLMVTDLKQLSSFVTSPIQLNINYSISLIIENHLKPKTTTFLVNMNATDTVSKVRNRISSIVHSEFLIKFKGTVLKNEKLLGDYGIKPDNVLKLENK